MLAHLFYSTTTCRNRFNHFGIQSPVASSVSEALQLLSSSSGDNNNNSTPFDAVIVDTYQGATAIQQIQREINSSSTALMVMGYSKIKELDYLPFLKKPIRDITLRSHFLPTPSSPTTSTTSTCTSNSPDNPQESNSNNNNNNSNSPTINSPSAIRILVAEDNILNRNDIRKLLHGMGYNNVEAVDNGRKALEFVKQTRFDIILMDIMVTIIILVVIILLLIMILGIPFLMPFFLPSWQIDARYGWTGGY